MRGRSKSWSSRALGCIVRFDAAPKEGAVDAQAACDAVVRAVTGAEPGADVVVCTDRRGGSVIVVVDPDRIAVLHGGPMHRAAVGHARRAADRGMNQAP